MKTPVALTAKYIQQLPSGVFYLRTKAPTPLCVGASSLLLKSAKMQKIKNDSGKCRPTTSGFYHEC